MDKNCSNVSLLATRLLLEDNYESPICHGAINGSGSSTWWCCYPSSACASQTAGLYDRHQRWSATRSATQRNTFRPLRNRSKITVGSMSRQDQEPRLRETYLTGQS